MEHDRRICYVKVIVNPHGEKSSSLRFCEKQANLKIVLTSVSDLNNVVADLKKQIILKNSFEVQWNWKNIPKEIKENQYFQNEIIEFFNRNIRVQPSFHESFVQELKA